MKMQTAEATSPSLLSSYAIDFSRIPSECRVTPEMLAEKRRGMRDFYEKTLIKRGALSMDPATLSEKTYQLLRGITAPIQVTNTPETNSPEATAAQDLTILYTFLTAKDMQPSLVSAKSGDSSARTTISFQKNIYLDWHCEGDALERETLNALRNYCDDNTPPATIYSGFRREHKIFFKESIKRIENFLAADLTSLPSHTPSSDIFENALPTMLEQSSSFNAKNPDCAKRMLQSSATVSRDPKEERDLTNHLRSLTSDEQAIRTALGHLATTGITTASAHHPILYYLSHS